MPSISLHIGLPKTATSYLQTWLHDNRDALGQRGVAVPAQPILAHRLAAVHLHGPKLESRPDVVDIRKVPIESAEQFVASAFAPGSVKTAVVSSEYFHHADPGDVLAHFRRLTLADIDIVVFVRSQWELAMSSYNQDVKRLGATRPYPRPAYKPGSDWALILDAWAGVFGKERMRVVSFDLSSRAGTILKDFVAAACPSVSADLAAGMFNDNTVFNPSLPADLVEFKRIANQWGEIGLADLLEDAIRSGYGGDRFGMSAEDIDAWRTLYAASNDRVARDYFGAASADDIFPVTNTPGTDLEGRLGAETLAKLFAFAWKHERESLNDAESRIRSLEEQVASLRSRFGEP